MVNHGIYIYIHIGILNLPLINLSIGAANLKDPKNVGRLQTPPKHSVY